MFNLIVRLVRDPALAEDLAQETFIRAFRSLATFDWGLRTLLLPCATFPRHVLLTSGDVWGDPRASSDSD